MSVQKHKLPVSYRRMTPAEIAAELRKDPPGGGRYEFDFVNELSGLRRVDASLKPGGPAGDRLRKVMETPSILPQRKAELLEDVRNGRFKTGFETLDSETGPQSRREDMADLKALSDAEMKPRGAKRSSRSSDREVLEFALQEREPAPIPRGQDVVRGHQSFGRRRRKRRFQTPSLR